MHCAWLPLLKHFTNGINVPERSAPQAMPAKRGGGNVEKKKWGEVEQVT